MNDQYRTFFGLNKEPFGTDISMSEILKTPELTDIKDRFDYVIRLGAIGLVTGEVGSGKSTALRYAMEKLHPSEYRTLYITACSLMRLEVFAELHTICQFEKDSKPWLPIILAGQNNLIDNLTYRSSQPLASRIVAKSHLQGIDLQAMEKYLQHHLAIAGVDQMLFDSTAVTAIHQGSGGLFRKANHLARGALIAAAGQQSTLVSAEHVRLAATEIF